MADNEILQMHDLKPAPGAKKDRTRVGRGEGSKGKTAGRGAKGQTKRNHVRPGFEGGQLPLYMRLPSFVASRTRSRSSSRSSTSLVSWSSSPRAARLLWPT